MSDDTQTLGRTFYKGGEFHTILSTVVTREAIAELLVSAFEGFSNDWIASVELVEPPHIDFKYTEEHLYKIYTYPLNVGGALKIRAEDDSTIYSLDLNTIRNGIELMAKTEPNQWAQFINETYDAVTGDLFLQLCLFKEDRYG